MFGVEDSVLFYHSIPGPFLELFTLEVDGGTILPNTRKNNIIAQYIQPGDLKPDKGCSCSFH
jgi:hypothetical protein